MSKIWIKAVGGKTLPLEHQPRRYVDDNPIEVEDSPYYRRAIADGDAQLTTAPKPQNTKGASNGKS